jgi:hypothetical protein
MKFCTVAGFEKLLTSIAVVLKLFLLVAHFGVSFTSVAPPLIFFNYKK